MNPVESRPLRYFVAVAEELNYTRAAERLGIAAPALSRAITRLEIGLGVRLLERSTRRVTLTDAGAVLLDEAQVALAALDAAVVRARRAAEPRPRLVVALKADQDGGLLETIVAAYERDPAARPVEVALCGHREQTRLLLEGRADVALVPGPADESGIDSEVLVEEPQILAIARTHPLASRAALLLEDVHAGNRPTAEPTIWLAGRLDHTDGELPPIGGLPQLLKLVELGQLLTLLPVSVASRYPRPQIAYRPVRDAAPASLVVAWPSRSRSLATAAFVRAAQDVAAARRSAEEREGATFTIIRT